MIRFTKKFYFWKVQDTWFVYQYRFSHAFTLAQFSFVKKHDSTPRFCVKDISHTVELSLEPGMESIIAGFRNTVKQEVRKAEQEQVTCSFREDTDRFIEFFNDFAALKKLYPAKKDMIRSMGAHFQTSFAEIDGEMLVAHSYLVDPELGICRLFQSASRRLDERFDRKLIGRANKLLTAKDIQHFKEKGFKLMDFGGYAENTSDKGLQGINDFKLSFGGHKAECINYYTWPYAVLRKLSLLLDRRYR